MKRRISTAAVTVAVMGALAVVVVGFYIAGFLMPPGRISAAELTGTWRGSDGFAVTFQQDGKFCAKNFPMNAEGSDRLSSCGTWRMKKPRPGDQGIHLNFADSKGFGSATLSAASTEELYIDWFLDDTSPGFSLKRVAD